MIPFQGFKGANEKVSHLLAQFMYLQFSYIYFRTGEKLSLIRIKLPKQV